VTLSSGREADYYVDLRRITLDGEAAPLVGRVMRDLTATSTSTPSAG
jgi:orotate phosphoribosyltransferase